MSSKIRAKIMETSYNWFILVYLTTVLLFFVFIQTIKMYPTFNYKYGLTPFIFMALVVAEAIMFYFLGISIQFILLAVLVTDLIFISYLIWRRLGFCMVVINE